MTIGEERVFGRAQETVRKMGELAQQGWWTAWIAYLDHARDRMPDLLVPRHAAPWKWLVKNQAKVLTFTPKKTAKKARAR